jgi:hypothetical protein
MTNTINKETRKMAQCRLDYLQSLLSGEKGFSGTRRLRSYRVEGTLSIRDAFRMEALLSDIASGSVNRKTYNRLNQEVPEFEQVMSSALISRIG